VANGIACSSTSLFHLDWSPVMTQTANTIETAESPQATQLIGETWPDRVAT
jgi:hypothetical protein